MALCRIWYVPKGGFSITTWSIHAAVFTMLIQMALKIEWHDRVQQGLVNHAGMPDVGDNGSSFRPSHLLRYGTNLFAVPISSKR